MITATVHIAPQYVEDGYGMIHDRVDERYIAGMLFAIGDRVTKIIIDLGEARFYLIDPDLIRSNLPADPAIHIEIVGARSDVVSKVLDQLDPLPTDDCTDCTDWLKCPTHQVGT